MIKVYLAGPITGSTPETAIAWRQKAVDYLSPKGFIVTSPLRIESNHLPSGESIPHDMFGTKHPLIEMRPRAVFARDMFDVLHADIIFANMTGCGDAGSHGSTFEMGVAWAKQKALILIAEQGNLYRKHPIMGQAQGVIFAKQEEALDYVARNWEPYVAPSQRTHYLLATAQESQAAPDSVEVIPWTTRK